MAKLASKHFNEEVVTWESFNGGLNLARPPEAISMDELQAVQNFEFSPETGLIKVRGGLEPVYQFEEPITDIFPIAGGEAVLVKSGMRMYRMLGGVTTSLGAVDGEMPGSFCYFGDIGNVAMVFGGRLYLYENDTQTMRRIESVDSPRAANAIFYSRQGRLAVTEIGSDVIRYSAIGDPEWWESDPDRADGPQWVEVGYQDGCQMQAIGEMAGEVLVFKCPPGQPDNGIIYRLQGEFPNWNVIKQSEGASAWNSNAVTPVANNLMFLTRQGMSSMATAMEYGDFRLSWTGVKVNPRLSLVLTDNCRLWHLPIKGQVWVWDGFTNDVWVYHYQIGEGAWTAFTFPSVVTAACAVNSNVYVGMGNIVYHMSEAATQDNLTGEGEVAPIEAFLKPKTLVKANEILVKRVRVNYLSTITAEAHCVIEGLRLLLPLNGQGDVAAEDTEVAAEDYDPLLPTKTSMYRARCQIRRWDVTPTIEVKNGLFSFSAMALNIAEI